MPKVIKPPRAESKTGKAIAFIIAFKHINGREPDRKEIVNEIGKCGRAVTDAAFRDSRVTGEVKITKTQKDHIGMMIRIYKKELYQEYESRVQERVKEYIAKHMPELERRREELSKKIEIYDNMTNKFKPIFTIDEFKSILMCLHPDGERSKERLEETFILFKSKEVQLVGLKK